VGVGAIQRGVQARANIAKLWFVLAFDGQLARRDVARVGIFPEVFRFPDLRFAGLPLDAKDLAKITLPSHVTLHGFDGVEKRQFPFGAVSTVCSCALGHLIEAGAVTSIELLQDVAPAGDADIVRAGVDVVIGKNFVRLCGRPGR